MKLKVTYKKTGRGAVTATVTVIDAGDYVSESIFGENMFVDERYSHIAVRFSETTNFTYSSSEIRAEVEKFIQEIKQSLDSWRATPVPADKNYII